MRIFLLLHIWDIFQMVEGFCFQAMILTKENSREQIKGCVHHSQAGVQQLWSLCSRAKSIKSSNRKISNCHWDYKSQITMHWDWDFVTHLKWGIWNFRISTSLSLKICNMSWPLAIFQNLRRGPLVGGLLLIENTHRMAGTPLCAPVGADSVCCCTAITSMPWGGSTRSCEVLNCTI